MCIRDRFRHSLTVPYSRLRLGGTAELLYAIMQSTLTMTETALHKVHGTLAEHITELHGSCGGLNSVMGLSQDIVHIKMVQTVLISLQNVVGNVDAVLDACLLYTSPSPRDRTRSRMPSSA
eukprot:TRINITY_DN25608_c0_g1_i1.p1 TRINITY_DN25608_c0_g1~~TRINITY_DN25608_c0_g1_i1.p1  ORF type:complete len:121 (+),score=48.08 TRINITY_DN25608_c0_g1_i1:88-450(+)